jgi:hypothetical protein
MALKTTKSQKQKPALRAENIQACFYTSWTESSTETAR